ncbi:MAG: hypothetical protein RL685_4417 [Pseudomonadota bacterium]
MQQKSSNDPFARPALHVLLALGFGAAFLWPIFAFTQPSKTFHFMYGAWLLSLGALYLVSRGGSATAGAGLESMPPASVDATKDEAVH